MIGRVDLILKHGENNYLFFEVMLYGKQVY
jgi:hypothetical protein